MFLIATQTYFDPNYNNCAVPMRLYFMALSAQLGFLIIFTGLMIRARQRCMKFMVYLTGISFCFFAVWCLIGLGVMTVVQIETPKCVPISYMISSWILILIFNYIFVAFIGKMLKAYCKFYKKQKRADKLRKGIDEVYEKIYKDNFDVGKFLKEYKEVLNLFNLTEKEISILRDSFGVKMRGDQTDLDENDKKSCVICLGEFEKGEELILHPGCKHTFHYECVVNWFKTKLVCPVCKCNTRENMIKNLKNDGNRDFSKRDEVLVADDNEFLKDSEKEEGSGMMA